MAVSDRFLCGLWEVMISVIPSTLTKVLYHYIINENGSAMASMTLNRIYKDDMIEVCGTTSTCTFSYDLCKFCFSSSIIHSHISLVH